MRRNTITFIELIIILCVIVAAVRVWNYKKPENKILPTPTPIFTHMEKTVNSMNGKMPPPTPTPIYYIYKHTEKTINYSMNGKMPPPTPTPLSDWDSRSLYSP